MLGTHVLLLSPFGPVAAGAIRRFGPKLVVKGIERAVEFVLQVSVGFSFRGKTATMQPPYLRLRRYARAVADECGQPRFYRDYGHEVKESLERLSGDPALTELRVFVWDLCGDDFGHGRRHLMLVTRDTGALVIGTARLMGIPLKKVVRIVRLGHAAGLLHDIRRKEPHHAVKGAETARRLLRSMAAFSPEEVDDIAEAIANHEAFTVPRAAPSLQGRIVSDCLYDADKFRWGPDNFTDTVWSMASYYRVPVEGLVAAYERGIEAIVRVRGSFRTELGRRYGPEIIDMGIRIGDRVMEHLKTEVLPTLSR